MVHLNERVSIPIKRIAGCILLALWAGCAIQRNQTAATVPAEGAITSGYALLFDLLKDEKDVSKLLVIKRERPELRTLIKEIAEAAGRAHKQLEAFAKADRSLNLNSQGLPAAEVETRAAIAKAKGKELLTEGGKQFELRLLLSQNEALTYAAHLTGTIVKTESNATRAGYLRQLAGELHGLQGKVTAMLLVNYNWPATK